MFQLTNKLAIVNVIKLRVLRELREVNVQTTSFHFFHIQMMSNL